MTSSCFGLCPYYHYTHYVQNIACNITIYNMLNCIGVLSKFNILYNKLITIFSEMIRCMFSLHLYIILRGCTNWILFSKNNVLVIEIKLSISFHYSSLVHTSLIILCKQANYYLSMSWIQCEFSNWNHLSTSHCSQSDKI